MAKTNVLREILEWSLDRPAWQRDALRRLITTGDFNVSDISDLSNICKSRHGLSDRAEHKPLDVKHLPQPDASTQSVCLESITHHIGVNALAQDQTIAFGPQLTAVYGANAAGKSGYTRILKRACRARGAEDILGNVVSGTIPEPPSATIRVTVNGESYGYLWDDNRPPDGLLSKVNVFDHHCASVYVAQRTDVAFRPMGLDLFDKLAQGCEAVRKALEKERDTLKSHIFSFPSIAVETTVYELVTDLTSLTDPDAVKQLSSLTQVQKERSKELRERISDLQSDDPERTARAIDIRANRAETLMERVSTANKLMSDSSNAALFAARNQMNEVRHLAENSHRTTFHEQPLANTGSEAWRFLWDAAEQFSEVDAYPDHSFPFTEQDSRCVLCQQELNNEGVRRLRQFQEFRTSSVQEEHDRATARYLDRRSQLDNVLILDELATAALADLELDSSDMSETCRAYLAGVETQRKLLNDALHQDLPRPDNLLTPSPNTQLLSNYVEKMRNRARELRKSNLPDVIKTLDSELKELEARQILGSQLDNVLEQIERKKKIAAYQLCIDETRTHSITRKSSEVTNRAVTGQLTASFADELDILKFRHVEVQMVAAGGSRGALYHKLELRRARGVEVAKVVSEGEARCLSIASFFAELSTAEDQSAILFDDPVSSLDHSWRANVAQRLVVESSSRQVIVFTHDIVFLLALVEKAEQHHVDLKHQYLRRDQTVAGLSSQELPWAAMTVRSRIGHLKDLWQAAETLYRKGEQERYERDAAYIYGLLREAWERGVEEVLLGGTVERYRKTIQTQRARQLSDISSADCDGLDAGMAKCSKWLPGHDQAAAENEPFPEPDELRSDITALGEWVQRIRNRR